MESQISLLRKKDDVNINSQGDFVLDHMCVAVVQPKERDGFLRKNYLDLDVLWYSYNTVSALKGSALQTWPIQYKVELFCLVIN